MVLQRVYNSGNLGEGTRSVSGSVQVTRTVGDPDVLVVAITVSPISNMNDAELADYQTFVDGLDEESTLAQALVILDAAE